MGYKDTHTNDVLLSGRFETGVALQHPCLDMQAGSTKDAQAWAGRGVEQ